MTDNAGIYYIVAVHCIGLMLIATDKAATECTLFIEGYKYLSKEGTERCHCQLNTVNKDALESSYTIIIIFKGYDCPETRRHPQISNWH